MPISSPVLTFLPCSFLGTIISGFFFTKIHLYLPHYFKTEAAFPMNNKQVCVHGLRHWTYQAMETI
jgi:hypothetical protein